MYGNTRPLCIDTFQFREKYKPFEPQATHDPISAVKQFTLRPQIRSAAHGLSPMTPALSEGPITPALSEGPLTPGSGYSRLDLREEQFTITPGKPAWEIPKLGEIRFRKFSKGYKCKKQC
jgi:hypothetical protein